MEEEIWKPIDGYEELYQVSNLGRVKSLERTVIRSDMNVKVVKERILKDVDEGNGYRMVTLYKDGKKKKHKVHRLVASAFISNPNNFPQVNHKDENKANNKVENLEFCTAKYNINYGTRIKRITEANKNNPKKSKPILQFDKEGNFIQEWKSGAEVQNKLGYHQTCIYKCCKGKRKSSNGYIWKYKNGETC